MAQDEEKPSILTQPPTSSEVPGFLTYKSGSGVNNRRTELFLKEHEHLRNTEVTMLNVILFYCVLTDLRKQARQLENELDLKLVSFSKLCTSYSSSRDGRRGDSSSDTTPLLCNSTQDRMFETMSVEIEQLLAKLTGVNDKMAEYTSTPGVTSLNAALMHTLQRHRDILQDYTHEFHKTKSNFMAIREREDLLGSVRKDIETYKSGSGVNNRRTELFLKEHEHLRNSDRLIDDTISIAMATKENMTSQRGLLKSIQSRVNTLANRFPAINNLIQRINLRKRRDSLILGGVIGICTILLLLYAFH
ncbi:Golgi SNAP receptor complex member 1 [Danio aesculapii]|uniref:Golgi SNAP receptor complex member 1 n=1 Tax=Danio aesculapii TaxID=1142201 RepID=UPI0024C01EFC|nr:Golgi SNAP receptor complex member 1 [Danio aesculapii]